MAGPSLEERTRRVRMALADIGLDPSLVYDNGRYDASVPRDVAWRAREAALSDTPMCWRCFEPFRPRMADRQCIATRPFESDCGVER